VRRFKRIFDLFDAVRIDHFLGFTRTWSIPAGTLIPADGRWVKSPGPKLFAAMQRQLGTRPMIAEDLGHVTAADIQLRDQFGLAPMRIFQFGFGVEPDSADHLPHNYPPLCVAHPGNHDNNTTVGWFEELRPAQRRRVQAYTGGHPATIHLDCLRTLLASPGRLIICPLQDVLGLGSRARMNVPGTSHGNWEWRLHSVPLARAAKTLRLQTELFGRSHCQLTRDENSPSLPSS
jgi:4-alpha-glucanotransferase